MPDLPTVVGVIIMHGEEAKEWFCRLMSHRIYTYLQCSGCSQVRVGRKSEHKFYYHKSPSPINMSQDVRRLSYDLLLRRLLSLGHQSRPVERFMKKNIIQPRGNWVTFFQNFSIVSWWGRDRWGGELWRSNVDCDVMRMMMMIEANNFPTVGWNPVLDHTLNFTRE